MPEEKTMHFDDDTLRAYLDNELGPVARLALQEHLGNCPDCAARQANIQATAVKVEGCLNSLASDQTGRFSPHAALQKFDDRRKEKMMKPLFHRPGFVVAGLVLIFAIALTFPPVQAMAGSFLGLFRVQQIRVVGFDPAAIQKYDGVMQENQSRYEAFFKDNLTITHQGEFIQVSSKPSAERLVGFTPRLPASTMVNSMGIEPAQTATLVIESATMNSVLEALGQKDVKIPADLDGQKITATIPASVSVEIGTCPSGSDATGKIPEPTQNAGCTRLVQLNSPTIDAPDRFPVVQLGEAMLQVLGLSPDQAKQFSQSIDWTTTLVIPVPTGKDVTSSDVTVDGVKGTLVSSSAQGQYTIFWIKDNRVYALSGWGDSSEGLDLANNLE
jgi:hypothetical protein